MGSVLLIDYQNQWERHLYPLYSTHSGFQTDIFKVESYKYGSFILPTVLGGHNRSLIVSNEEQRDNNCELGTFIQHTSLCSSNKRVFSSQ